jgi:hypothetical protein
MLLESDRSFVANQAQLRLLQASLVPSMMARTSAGMALAREMARLMVLLLFDAGLG